MHACTHTDTPAPFASSLRSTNLSPSCSGGATPARFPRAPLPALAAPLLCCLAPDAGLRARPLCIPGALAPSPRPLGAQSAGFPGLDDSHFPSPEASGVPWAWCPPHPLSMVPPTPSRSVCPSPLRPTPLSGATASHRVRSTQRIVCTALAYIPSSGVPANGRRVRGWPRLHGDTPRLNRRRLGCKPNLRSSQLQYLSRPSPYPPRGGGAVGAPSISPLHPFLTAVPEFPARKPMREEGRSREESPRTIYLQPHSWLCPQQIMRDLKREKFKPYVVQTQNKIK